MTTQTRTRYQKIRFHKNPHRDEIFVALMLQRWCKGQAEQNWLGSSTAIIDFLTTGVIIGEPKNDDLYIGCGKTWLDDHGATIFNKNECATTMIARQLGVIDRPELRKIIAEILEEDRNGTTVRLHLPSVIKLLYYLEEPMSLTEIIEWTRQACAAEINPQCGNKPVKNNGPLTLRTAHALMKNQEGGAKAADLWRGIGEQAIYEASERRNVAREMIKDIPMTVIDTTKGQAKLLVVQNGNDQVASAAWGKGADILVRTRETGNMEIVTRRSREFCLRNVAALMRAEELNLRGLPPIEDQQLLRNVDVVDRVPMWHLMDTRYENKSALFNGSSATAPDVEPSRIPVPHRLELLKIGLQ